MIAHDHHELKELEQKVYIRRQSLNCDFTTFFKVEHPLRGMQLQEKDVQKD